MHALLPALLQVAPPRDSIAVAADVASIVIAVAVLIVVVMAGILFLRVHRILGEVRLGVRQNLGPVSDRARAISDNLEFITQVLRSDVESLNASVKALTDRLTLASERMEERIEEFNALMEVVQGEAEDIFLDTAATVRGVRESARAIAAGPGKGEERGGGQADDEPGRAEEEGGAEEEGDAEPALSAAEERDAPPDGDS